MRVKRKFVENNMEVRIKKVMDGACLPQKAHAQDAGFDLMACKVERVGFDEIVCHTGLAFEIPDGYVGLLFPRSSIARTAMMLKNSVGVLDSCYRGEVTFKFRQLDNGDTYNAGDKIGQIIIMPYPEIVFVESDNLSETERGSGCYGSTGR